MRSTTTSSTTDNAARRLAVLGSSTAILLAVAVLGAFLVAPEDSDQGVIQRIFYFHVSIALVSLFAFAVSFVSGILYLRRRDQKYDEITVVSVGLGLMFSALVVITGSIWAKASWGTWWVWEDPRLVTYLIVILLYAAFFMLRSSADGERQARYSAIFAVVSFAAVPLSFYSVRVATSFVHPVVLDTAGSKVPGSMMIWFVVSLVGMIGLFLTLLQLELMQRRADRSLRDLKMRLERAAELRLTRAAS
jgi:heme exporter protein C